MQMRRFLNRWFVFIAVGSLVLPCVFALTIVGIVIAPFALAGSLIPAAIAGFLYAAAMQFLPALETRSANTRVLMPLIVGGLTGFVGGYAMVVAIKDIGFRMGMGEPGALAGAAAGGMIENVPWIRKHIYRPEDESGNGRT
jgi:hypothetical protein